MDNRVDVLSGAAFGLRLLAPVSVNGHYLRFAYANNVARTGVMRSSLNRYECEFHWSIDFVSETLLDNHNN